MTTVLQLHNQQHVVQRLALLLKCKVFLDNPELSRGPYVIKSPVSTEVFHNFAATIDGVPVARVAPQYVNEFLMLCEEFGYLDKRRPKPEVIQELLRELNDLHPYPVIEYLREGAQQGLAYAQYKYAYSLAGQNDEAGAISYMGQAALQRYAPAQVTLNQWLAKGLDVHLDRTKVLYYMRQVASSGNPEMQYCCAELLLATSPNSREKCEASAYLKRAADQGHIAAQYRFAHILQSISPYPSDIKRSGEYFMKAANQGHREAQYQYACYLAGECDNPENVKIAAEYFQKAADQGHLDAAFSRNWILARSLGIQRRRKNN